MKIKFLATGQSPDYYSFSGNTITAHLGGQTESYDLSDFGPDAVFQGADPIEGVPAIRGVEHKDGELHVTLCQQVGPGHWSESGWMDSGAYDPDAVYAAFAATAKGWTGIPWAKTRQGRVEPRSGAILEV